jgi:hypothetical protein
MFGVGHFVCKVSLVTQDNAIGANARAGQEASNCCINALGFCSSPFNATVHCFKTYCRCK